MTTEQLTQQLELAAQILRTGHPFEVRHDASDRWHASLGVNPAQAVLQDWHIRPILATPPDNRPLHNPDNLTAEAVEVGYRLALKGESAASPHDFWDGNTWREAKLLGPAIFAWCCRSCRLPLSVPWPEPADPYAELKAAHADEKKTVPQSSTFFFPGTVIRFPDATDLWGAVTAINQDGLVVGDTYQSYQELADSKAMANRSIPLTGKWNPDAWEPCSKTIPA